MKQIEIAGRPIGEGRPCFIIGEAGVNHNGDVDLARKLVDAAADAGVDAIKFQTYNSDQLVAPDAAKADYQVDTTGASETQGEMLRKLELPTESFQTLQGASADRDVTFISTPFDHDSVDLLDSLGVPAFKVGSGDLTNLPLLRHIASKGRPMILSTGMSYLGEVERALVAVHETGNEQVAILHCVSAYPTEPRDANLRAMQTIDRAFGVPVGFSDHTQGLEVPLAAVALGASIIEKHFTLDRNMEGPDHRASLEPGELKELVRGIRDVESALGDGHKRPTEAESNIRGAARRSIYLRNEVSESSVLQGEDLICLRPAGGIPPDQIDMVEGRKMRHTRPAGTALTWSDLD
jgi:N-acetylneuraminate synthase/N,N'-diacetyllegionaminate synthase